MESAAAFARMAAVLLSCQMSMSMVGYPSKRAVAAMAAQTVADASAAPFVLLEAPM